jgi:hypothetical protein
MKQNLAQLLVNQISSGLRKKSVTSCSKWAETYRVMGKPYPGPWTFKYHPWLKGMHDSQAEVNVGQKCAQVGFTEWALNTTFYLIDVRRIDCLYILPAQTPDAGDFSAARFAPALEMSPYLSNLFTNVDNVGHKRAGTANLYIRGSKSRSGLKSIPTGGIILDELDEMDQNNVPLALERAAGQLERKVLAISTPTLPNYGINKMFRESTMEHFFFTCPGCSRRTQLTFPESLVITGESPTDPLLIHSHIICSLCKKKLDHRTKSEWLSDNEWVPAHKDRSSRGFYLNQLYSMTVSPVDLARSYLKAQTDRGEEQEFYNSKMGLEHIVEGSSINDSDIDSCIHDYFKRTSREPNTLITMGVDVGKWLHVEIDEWKLPDHGFDDINTYAIPKVIYQNKVLNFEQLDELMYAFGVAFCVIDAHPERRLAFSFASRFRGYVKLCFYGNSVNGKQITVNSEDEETITVDRTSWMDLALGRFRTNKIMLPKDIDFEYRDQIKAPVRIYRVDRKGNAIAAYVEGNRQDHYAHARTYAEIALPFVGTMMKPQNIWS